jgi:cell division protein FtsI/penicillin-binding protein 2
VSRLSPLRPFYLLAPLGLLYLAIAGRFVQLHAYKVELSETYSGNLEGESVLLADRGRILDRNGYPLAYDRPSYTLEYGYRWEHRRYNPANWSEGEPMSEEQILAEVAEVAAVTGIDAEKLESDLRDPSLLLTAILFDIDPFHADRIRGMMAQYPNFGLVVREARTREYPLGRAASHAIGLYDEYLEERETGELDESGEAVTEIALARPAMAIESAFMEQLTGVKGRKESVRIRHGINPAKILVEPVDGEDVLLTIDATLQELVRIELVRVMREQNPEAAAAIVLDVRTGEILAMHSLPDFDPSSPSKDDDGLGADGEAVSLHFKFKDPFEPGSTFKTIIVATALDLGVIRPDEHFPDGGSIRIGPRFLENASSVPKGSKTAMECLLHSSNVVATRIAQRIGVPRLRAAMERIGVWNELQLTGHRLSPGASISEEEWGTHQGPVYTLPSVSFGQGFYINPIRLAGLLTAFANDGNAVVPYLVQGEGSEPEPICTPASAAYVRDAMHQMMERQVHHNKFLPDIGVEAAAKSGTARNESNHRENTVLFSTFAPVEDPEVLVLAVVYNPDVDLIKSRKGPSGTRHAGPLATRILEHALRIRGVLPPADPRSLESVSALGTLKTVRDDR